MVYQISSLTTESVISTSSCCYEDFFSISSPVTASGSVLSVCLHYLQLLCRKYTCTLYCLQHAVTTIVTSQLGFNNQMRIFFWKKCLTSYFIKFKFYYHWSQFTKYHVSYHCMLLRCSSHFQTAFTSAETK